METLPSCRGINGDDDEDSSFGPIVSLNGLLQSLCSMSDMRKLQIDESECRSEIRRHRRKELDHIFGIHALDKKRLILSSRRPAVVLERQKRHGTMTASSERPTKKVEFGASISFCSVEEYEAESEMRLAVSPQPPLSAGITWANVTARNFLKACFGSRSTCEESWAVFGEEVFGDLMEECFEKFGHIVSCEKTEFANIRNNFITSRSSWPNSCCRLLFSD